MKKTTYCNPLDLGYRFQHFREGKSSREGADPTLVLFKGVYYLFVSMSAGFWYSDDLINWQFHEDKTLDIYDYAPDVRQLGDWLYFCASEYDTPSPILRTRDPLREPFEKVSAPFIFSDPDLFIDEDGRAYFYWGCSNTDPIYGIELDPATMLPIGEKKALIFNRETELGYERRGDDGKESDRPYIEGAFMTKHGGRYYLQYACPGTQYNTYADGVYVSEKPLGPFALQDSNPFSSKPGGFITGAGHGSTIADKAGNYWHAATMRISMSHMFERRVGLFPAGFDKDGILYCNQNFADYPHEIPASPFDAAAQEPKWMLLSWHKPVLASSTVEGSAPALAVDEDIRTWWSAGTAAPGEWLRVDLEKAMDVRAVQVSFANDIRIVKPEESYHGDRSMELMPQITHYLLESSLDGSEWTVLDEIDRECSNGYSEFPTGVTARYIRVTGLSLPYGETMRLSGVRVFGNGGGEKPEKARAWAERTGPMDARVFWEPIPGAQGCNIRYGIAPDKLYASRLVYGENTAELTMLIAGRKYWAAVDSFNENGITYGKPFYIG